MGYQKYRKKPVVITAFHFERLEQYDQACWFTHADLVAEYFGTPQMQLIISTLEGDIRVSLGDWIIRGVKGEYYPCKSDIFEATYELVRENNQ